MAKTAQSIAADAENIKESGIAEEKRIGQDTDSLIASTELFILMSSVARLCWSNTGVDDRPNDF